ncbi:MAG: hypothetical protein AAGH65_07790 [Pseudomonadota bacterium]
MHGFRSNTRTAIIGLLLFGFFAAAALTQDNDLKALATAKCEFGALTVLPPTPWYSVPIDAAEPGIDGCQMIWEVDDQYMGIIRLVAFETRMIDDLDVPWERFVVLFEATILSEMNIELGEVLWRNDAVPIQGEGFSNARAVALAARVPGVEHANEAHFLLFESEAYKYVLSNMTPAESVSPDVYTSNTGAMGTLMRTLQPKP